ncbi:MAG: hypothetical protein ACLTSX_11725 [Collinsella sp.]
MGLFGRYLTGSPCCSCRRSGEHRGCGWFRRPVRAGPARHSR